MRSVRFVGPGRAGCSMALALRRVGWDVAGFVGRGDDVSRAAHGVDLLVISTPDDEISGVAARIRPQPATTVMHLSGALGLDVLSGHRRRAALHPLVPLPDAEVGAERLASGITFAVAGDPMAGEVAESLGGRTVVLAESDRAAYHAAACIAANHVVALLGQVERVAAATGIPIEAFLDLTRSAVDDVARLGPRRALTGPASRGDRATLARHREAMDPAERLGYDAGVALVERLVERPSERPAERLVGGGAGVAAERGVGVTAGAGVTAERGVGVTAGAGVTAESGVGVAAGVGVG